MECLVCGAPCKLQNDQIPKHLRELQQEWSSKTSNEELLWILGLDLHWLDKNQCVCPSCAKLLSDLQRYEILVSEIQSELLQRHENRGQSIVPVSVPHGADGITADRPAEGLSGPASGLRRSARRRGRPSAPTTAEGGTGKQPSGPRRGRRRANPLDLVQKTEPAATGVAAAAGGEEDDNGDREDGCEREDGDGEDAGSSDEAAPSDADSEYVPPRPPAARTPVPVLCDECGQCFRSRAGLVIHRSRAHRLRRAPAGGANSCAVCDKTFKCRSSLVTHRRLVHGKGERCRHCDAVFRNFSQYYRHLADAHGIKEYVCQHCGAGFARRVMLNRHLVKEARTIKRAKLVEQLKTMQCSVCDYRPAVKSYCRETSLRSRIRDHEHRAHGLHGAVPEGVTVSGVGDERHTCDECGQVYGCRLALLIHKKTHREPAPTSVSVTQCEYCGKEFNSTYLKTHQEAVHKLVDPSELITCEFCGKQYHKFQRKHYLSHLQKIHMMDQEFHCTEPHCRRTFQHQRGLLRHVRNYHQQCIPCGLCPEGFPSPWKRDKHRAEVHGQYDFICDECGLKFFRRSELEIHTRRVHTLQLRYQCAVCSHRSEERRKLLNHEHAAHGLHAAPLPAHNPAGQLGYPCPACRAVYACGLAAKQHAWDAHQIKLNIYGRPKNPVNKLGAAAAAPTADNIAAEIT